MNNLGTGIISLMCLVVGISISCVNQYTEIYIPYDVFFYWFSGAFGAITLNGYDFGILVKIKNGEK